MNAMDHTIAGAASGETAGFSAAPKGSLSQAKGQKSTKYLFVMLISVSMTTIICYSYDLRDWRTSNLFF